MSAVELADPDEAERWRVISARNLGGFWEYPARIAGQRWARWDDVWAADPASPCAYLNSATLQRRMPGGASTDAEALVRRLRDLYAGSAGGPWMLWSPWPTPDLSPYGLQLVGHPPLMVRPPGDDVPAPPRELRIVEVSDEAALRTFEATFVDGYPEPALQPAISHPIFDARVLGGPLHLWIGFVDEAPVAVAASLIGEQAVSVFMVATLPQARGKGYGAALTVRALRVAPGLPAELQASDDGRPVYLRLGFQIITYYDLWMAPRAAAGN